MSTTHPQQPPTSTQINEKSSKFHYMLREKHIEALKAKVRKQNQCQQNLQHLLETLPKQLQDVLIWCQNVKAEFMAGSHLLFPDLKIIELFKLIQRFPCLETVQLMHSVTHRMSTAAIHQLFQYDIVGLMHQLIIHPQKIIPKILLTTYPAETLPQLLLQITKKSMLILASLSQLSQKARNFIVMSHKSYLCINKVYNKYGVDLEQEFVVCLYGFTKFRMGYHQQFVRIVRAACVLFCNQGHCLSYNQMLLAVSTLTSVVKCKEKWCMDLIQQVSQYDVLDKILKLLHSTIQSAISIISTTSNTTINTTLNTTTFSHTNHPLCLKQLGCLTHTINIFLMNYMQVTTNQYFDWQNFFTQWFTILKIEDSAFSCARRDVYFIFNNVICQAEEPLTCLYVVRCLVFQYDCVRVFAGCLETEVNEDVLQELAYCIHSLLEFKNLQTLSHDITHSNLLHNILQTITRNFNAANPNTKQTLLSSILHLLYRTDHKQIRRCYVYEIRNYQAKLMEICLMTRGTGFQEILERVWKEVEMEDGGD